MNERLNHAEVMEKLNSDLAINKHRNHNDDVTLIEKQQAEIE